MADLKISGLTADTTPTGVDYLTSIKSPFGSGSNRKVLVSDLLKVPSVKTRLAVGAADYNPSALTRDYYIGMTDTAAARAVTISSEDVATGSATAARVMVIKDESGACSTHNITVSLESGGTIDGAASYVMNADLESITLYIDGTNAHIIY